MLTQKKLRIWLARWQKSQAASRYETKAAIDKMIYALGIRDYLSLAAEIIYARADRLREQAQRQYPSNAQAAAEAAELTRLAATLMGEAGVAPRNEAE